MNISKVYHKLLNRKLKNNKKTVKEKAIKKYHHQRERKIKRKNKGKVKWKIRMNNNNSQDIEVDRKINLIIKK